jgi:four helix bundle protein
MVKTFKEIIVWQKAHQLVLKIYNITKSFPKFEEFALVNQMRRCAVSIPSNIEKALKENL